MTTISETRLTIPLDHIGKRIDQALAMLLPDYSRSQLSAWLTDGSIKINQSIWKQKQKVKGGETVEVKIPMKIKTMDQPEPMKLSIVFEDNYLLVVNKPVNLVVHPGAGNRTGTLMNALLHYHPPLAQLPRAGIVHRLDKDTSGLLIVAKTMEAYTKLIRLLQARKISREYEAIIQGTLTGGGIIDSPIGRHPTQRTKMCIQEEGRPSTTRYYVIERFRGYTHIRVELETGRTHQIRVHLASITHPVVGDAQYGGRMKIPKETSATLFNALHDFKRQALHAVKLSFQHPITKKPIELRSLIAKDIKKLLALLKQDRIANGG